MNATRRMLVAMLVLGAGLGLHAPRARDVEELVIRDQPVRDVLLDFAREAGMSVVPDAEVDGRISMVLHRTTSQDTLQRIIAGAGLYARREQGVVLVSRSLVTEEAEGWRARSTDGSLTLLLRRLSSATGMSLAYPAVRDRRVSLDLAAPDAMALVRAVATATGLDAHARPHHLELRPADAHAEADLTVDGTPRVELRREAGEYRVVADVGPTAEVLAALAAQLGGRVVICGNLPAMRAPLRLAGTDIGLLVERIGAVLELQTVRQGREVLVAAASDPGRLRAYHEVQRLEVAPELQTAVAERARSLGLVVLDQLDDSLLVSGLPGPLARLRETARSLGRESDREAPLAYRCSYLTPAAAAASLRESLPRLDMRITTAADGRTVLIRTPHRNHERVRTLLLSLDTPPRQIRFDLCIIQYQAGHAISHGVDMQADYERSGLVRATPLAAAGSFDGMLALQFDMASRLGYRAALAISDELSSNEARLVLDTRLRAVDGVEATLENSSTFRYRDAAGATDEDREAGWYPVVREIDSGLSVSLTGHAHRDRSVTVDVRIALSRQGSDDSRTGDPPPTSERAVRSRVRLRPGQPLVIGGLLQSETSRSDHRFPLLGRIPLVRSLLNRWDRRTEETELVVYLSAEPDPDEGPEQRRARQLAQIRALGNGDLERAPAGTEGPVSREPVSAAPESPVSREPQPAAEARP